ncbi:hypothetical protein KI387_003701, partial [Taxus chinensis]
MCLGALQDLSDELQDFEQVYDAKFGRKRGDVRQNGHSQATKEQSNDHFSEGRAVGNGVSRNTASSAVYEQYLPQENNGMDVVGVAPERSKERLQKGLLPAFDSVEMRTLGESISR